MVCGESSLCYVVDILNMEPPRRRGDYLRERRVLEGIEVCSLEGAVKVLVIVFGRFVATRYNDVVRGMM